LQNGRFTANGKYILIGGSGTVPADGARGAQEFSGDINLFDPVSGRHERTFEVPAVPDHLPRRYSLATVVSPDSRTLYVSYDTGEIIAYDITTGKSKRTFTGHRGFVCALEINTDGKRLISGGRDGLAIVWDTTSNDAPRK
jgi:WD40 repeat protein